MTRLHGVSAHCGDGPGDLVIVSERVVLIAVWSEVVGGSELHQF